MSDFASHSEVLFVFLFLLLMLAGVYLGYTISLIVLHFLLQTLSNGEMVISYYTNMVSPVGRPRLDSAVLSYHW